ncbi:hypothetical protein GDO81_000759 [Engystomops pustulosus]|uniref:Uncharacterized protein n=1 Tax=Engystomops pustulosus TaxID=76066 RepID=A0AAV7D6Y5_ENGPU|nr:hypothetical protein GDO81_000759 [Engystomops pustulosus]
MRINCRLVFQGRGIADGRILPWRWSTSLLLPTGELVLELPLHVLARAPHVLPSAILGIALLCCRAPSSTSPPTHWAIGASRAAGLDQGKPAAGFADCLTVCSVHSCLDPSTILCYLLSLLLPGSRHYMLL